MPTHSEFKERIDVLDIIISILKEHEGNLSNLVERFDVISNDFASFQEKMATLDRSLERLDRLRVKKIIGAVGSKGPIAEVRCKDWLTFQSAGQGALLVAYEFNDEQFTFSSVSDLFIFTYSNGLPEVRMLMSNGVGQGLKSHQEDDFEATFSGKISSKDGESMYEMIINPRMLKRWLSSELGVPENKIIEGRVLH